MLVHTSVMQEDHARWKVGILELFGLPDQPEGQCLDSLRLQRDIDEDEASWKDWYLRFEASLPWFTKNGRTIHRLR